MGEVGRGGFDAGLQRIPTGTKKGIVITVQYWNRRLHRTGPDRDKAGFTVHTGSNPTKSFSQWSRSQSLVFCTVLYCTVRTVLTVVVHTTVQGERRVLCPFCQKQVEYDAGEDEGTGVLSLDQKKRVLGDGDKGPRGPEGRGKLGYKFCLQVLFGPHACRDDCATRDRARGCKVDRMLE